MSAPNPYGGTDEDFDPTTHWGSFPGPTPGRTYTGESVASHDPSGEGFYSQEAGEESITGVIDSKRLRGFLRYCLGYNNMTTASSYMLQRTNPICHPRFTNLVCTGVAHRPFRPIRQTAVSGSTNQKLKLPRNDDFTGVVAVTEAGPGSTPHTFPYFAGYDKEQVTLRFSPAPYRFAVDDASLKEYQRNTIIDTEPRTEVLTLSGFQMIYAEGNGNTAPITNPYPKVAPGELGQVLIKPDVKISWFRVPEKFISQNSINAPGQLYPSKILRALGKVNKTDWISYKKGTLLFSGVHFMRKPWSLAAGGGGVTEYPANARESIFNYDVEFLFTHFDPPKGYHNNALIVDGTVLGTGTTGADTRGHNCLPYRGEPTGALIASDDKNAGKWFIATYSGQANYIGNPVDAANPGSKTLYEYSNFDNIFDSTWNPDIT